MTLELFQEGKLTEAIREQDRLVLAHPNDAAARLLLCEFLLFNGELDHIRAHLELLPCDVAGMNEYRADFRLLLDAEVKRRRILADSGNPAVLADPPEHLAKSLDALSALRAGKWSRSVELLDEADALFPGASGHVDGREFDDIRDGDDLFASVLEVVCDGEYAWFPFDDIARLKLHSRDSLRNRFFVPASLQSHSGQTWNVYLPALYPNTHLHDDEEVRAGQATDWFAEDDGPIRGVGLRVLNFGDEELTLLDFELWEE